MATLNRAGMLVGAGLVALVISGLVALVSTGPGQTAGASSSPTPCSGNYVLAGAPSPARALRFGIAPEPAGSVGTTQTSSKPVSQAKTMTALRALRPPGKDLVIRVSRLFESEGRSGIRAFKRMIDRYTRAGFDTELQVRYHPTVKQAGNIPAWTRYVRQVVDALGSNPHLIAMTITNEINLAISPNTSDGSFPGAEQALVKGIIAAHREAVRRGFKQLRFGFTFAYRFNPVTDAAVFTGLRSGGKALRQALGFVGVDYYPELYPGLSSGRSIPAATLQMMSTMRRCFMRLGGLGRQVPLWVTESGFDSTPGKVSLAQQRAALRQIVGTIHRADRTYDVTDYRWFNLRDNLSASPGLFQTTGLLTDTYTHKPAFGAYRSLIARFGARSQ
jgi:hypothetical protein